MFDAISPSDEAVTNPTRGQARVSFRDSNGKTICSEVYASDPLRVLFPTPAPRDVTQAVIATTSGGLVGGDRLSIEIAAGEDVAALVTPQAAEKIYRSTGAHSRVDVHLAAANGSWLEWLPQETILFDGAQLHRTTMVDLSAEAAVLAGEMRVFGRIARGERFASGYLRDVWELRRDGRLIWADALRLSDDIEAIRNHPAGLGGAVAVATAVYAAPDASARLAAARDILNACAKSVLTGATMVNDILVARWLSKDSQALRAALGEFWQLFRADVRGLPDVLPRIWHV